MSDDVTIGRCEAAEIVDVMQFIDDHWAHGHVLATCRPLLDWQHREADGTYSIIVARRDGDRAVLGILGYIPTRRYDAGLADENVVWLTTWMVRHEARASGLGLTLLQYLRATEPHVAIGAIGLNPATTPIYQALGYRVGELEHYVRPNETVERFELAAFAQPRVACGASVAPIGALALSREDFLERAANVDWRAHAGGIPQKTSAYFHARYLCHPLYSYVVVGLVDHGSILGLLAARVAEHAGRRALRSWTFWDPPDCSSESAASCSRCWSLTTRSTRTCTTSASIRERSKGPGSVASTLVEPTSCPITSSRSSGAT